MNLQKTLSSAARIEGVGIHSGKTTSLIIKPAKANTGITFVRTDYTHQDNQIKALWKNVIDTTFCTKIANAQNVSVSTVEHIMGALYACEIDNAIVEIDGPEVPILDGSAAPFIKHIDNSGIKTQNAPRPQIEVLRTISIEEANRWVSISPATSLVIDCTFSFGNRASFKPQNYRFTGDIKEFRNEISNARTFGFLQDIEKLESLGLVKGGSIDNAIVIDQDKIINPEGFRHKNECVRHKVLDAAGDLYLAGAPIKGYFQAKQNGHELHNKLLRALFADEKAWRLIYPTPSPHTHLAPRPATVSVGAIA